MSPEPGIEERSAIFGLETEHVVLYLSESDERAEFKGRGAPSFRVLEEVLFECLLAGRKAALSSGVKGGYFLENGGLVHLEAFLRKQADTPILEVATPECRSPRDVLVYSRAYDQILEETSLRSRAALRKRGFAGQIAFGKNNVDPAGTGFGCHENYLVYSKPTTAQRTLILLGAPLVVTLFLPAILFLIVVLAAAFLVLLAARLMGSTAAALLETFRKTLKAWPRLAELGHATYCLATTMICFPGVYAYSLILRATALRPFVRGLTPFLVTRQVFAGSGFVNFKAGVLELAQRPRLTQSVARIVLLGRKKTIFDLKGFLFPPWSVFRTRQRLSLTVGDSNLCDVPNLLKVGTTALLIEMIERGASFNHLRLRRPLKALKSVSTEGPWKVLELRSGRILTAIEIQREYLSMAREFFQHHTQGRPRHAEILDLWEETLRRLSDRPMSLGDTLDWVAKKSLLDAAVLAHSNWKVFFAWGRVLESAGLQTAARARSLGELVDKAPASRRFRLRRLVSQGQLDETDFSRQRDLYFQARKIDLRFHEIGGGTGYQRQMEEEGLIRRVTDPQDVSHAVQDAPKDTRARIRGYYIRNSREPRSLQVSWNEIELLEPSRHIPTPDPFHHRLPLE